jgi:hypothetical protein
MENPVSGDALTALVEQAKRDAWAHIGEAETAHLHGNAQSEGLHRALAQVHHWFAVEIEKAAALIAAGRSAATTEPPCGLCGTTTSADGDWYRICGTCRWESAPAPLPASAEKENHD